MCIENIGQNENSAVGSEWGRFGEDQKRSGFGAGGAVESDGARRLMVL